MRRDYFEVECSGVDESNDRPVIAITYDGPTGLLTERLSAADGTLDASELDVAYRQTAEGDETAGVLSIANRITGDFVLETNVESATIESLVGAAGDGDGTSYQIRLTDGDGKSTIYDKEILLVYDESGSLCRGESLIPGGVEL